MRKNMLVVLLVLGLLQGTAFADTTTRTDGDDANGLLDLQSGTHTHLRRADSQRLLVHELRTHEAWREREWGDSYVRVLFSTDDDPTWERQLYVARTGGNFYAEMTSRRGKIVGYAKVFRPNRRTLRMEFPKALLPTGTDSYKWFATSVFSEPSHPDCGTQGDVAVLCFDRLPNRGRITHHLD